MDLQPNLRSVSAVFFFLLRAVVVARNSDKRRSVSDIVPRYGRRQRLFAVNLNQNFLLRSPAVESVIAEFCIHARDQEFADSRTTVEYVISHTGQRFRQSYIRKRRTEGKGVATDRRSPFGHRNGIQLLTAREHSFAQFLRASQISGIKSRARKRIAALVIGF